MQQLLEQIVSEGQQVLANGHWYGLLGLALIYVIRIYRMDVIQALVPAKARWEALPMWARRLSPFVLAFLGALVIKLAAGIGWAAALIAAVGMAATSIAGHAGAKIAIKDRARDVKGRFVKADSPAPVHHPGASISLDPQKFSDRNGPPPSP